MRNTEERVKAALLRANQLQRNRKKQQLQGVAVGTTLLSLCLVVLLAYAIPPMVVDSAEVAMTAGFSASIFANPQSLSYIIIGILSFILGVSVTILCLLLRKKYQEDGDHES